MLSNVKLTITSPFTADDVTLVQTLYALESSTALSQVPSNATISTPTITAPSATNMAATTTTPAAATTTAPTTTTAPAAAAPAGDPNFPADPGSAPFPSPENSSSLWLGGPLPSGKPYLRDATGSVYQIRAAVNPGAMGTPMVNGAPENGARLYVNGTMVVGGYPVASMVVRQGMVYLTIASGQVQNFVAAMGSTYNASLPPAWLAGTTTAAPVPLPPLPADPTPSAIAPGSSGRSLTVAVGQTLQSVLDQAQAGDTVTVSPGTYTAGGSWKVPLKLVLTGAVFDLAGQTANLPHGMGAFTPGADSIIQDGEIKNVALDQTTAQMTSAIRPNGPCFLTLNGVNMHDCQVGYGSGGFAVVATLNKCTIANCGLGDGYTHGIYSHGNSLTLNDCTVTSPKGGHAVKSRDPQLTISGGSFDATDATVVDMSDGTGAKFTFTGATFTKPAGSANHGVIGYAMESQGNGAAGGSITGGSIAALCDNPLIQTTGGTIAISGVTFTGNKVTTAGGGTVTGL